MWGAQFADANGRRRVALGSYPDMGLGEAREAARTARLRARTGGGQTLRSLLDAYAARDTSHIKRWAEHRRTIELVFAAHMDSSCQHITILDLQKCVDGYRARAQAFKAVSHLRPVLQWGRKRKMTDLVGEEIEQPKGVNKRRQRVLALDELERIVVALRQRKYIADDILMLLLLTACRREEIAGLTWAEVTAEGINIDPARHKASTGHFIPLPAQAWALLPPRSTGVVFPRVWNWDRYQKSLFKRTGTSGWQRHDLRRTVATLLASRFQYPPHVIEAVLGHAHVGGTALASVYNTSRYLPEHTEALQKLADYYDTIT